MVIVDSMMLIRRCHAKMDFLTNAVGQHTGLEFGSLRTLEMLDKKFPDQKIVLCWEGCHNLRKEKYPQYKANRTRMSDSFYARVNKFKRFLNCHWLSAECDGYEADDVMYSIALITPGKQYIYTNDKDLLQAVLTPDITVLKSFQSKLFEWTSSKIVEEYGVPVRYLAEYFAFIGDSSDNIKGVPRIKKKAIADLIVWAHSCELSQDDMLNEIKSADWGPALCLEVRRFIDSGKWHENYDLIKLNVVSPLHVKQPVLDEKFIKECLVNWEIKTLKLCEQYDLLKEEEF